VLVRFTPSKQDIVSEKFSPTSKTAVLQKTI
jgi:hypothetical protein